MNISMQVVGWTLIHFVWQGTAIGLVVGAALRLTERRSPSVRYLIACAGLAAMLAAPAATARLLWSEPGEAAIVGQISEDPFARLKARVPPAIPDSRSARLQPSGADRASARLNAFDAQQVDRLVRGVTLTWLAGVVLLLARMAGGWWHVRRLHRHALATSSSRWQTTCRRIAYRLGLPAAAHVVESARVDVPTVVGWLRPAILLPVAAMATLTPAQVEAILAHELAHIRRHDYLVNLLQTVAETLLFYHPAVWWLSKRIRAEREHCCDEVAVSLCGDAVAYAKALAELEARRTPSTVLAVAATGGPLLDRVRRILRVPLTEEPRSQSWASTIVLTLLFTAGAGSVQHLSWISPQTDARASSAAAAIVEQPAPAAIAASTRQFLEVARQITRSTEPQPPAPPEPPEPPTAPQPPAP